MKEIISKADDINKYINDLAPWNIIKTDENLARQICTTALNALFLLGGLLKPVLPNIAQGIEKFLNIGAISWAQLDKDITEHQINNYERLAERIEEAITKKLVA